LRGEDSAIPKKVLAQHKGLEKIVHGKPWVKIIERKRSTIQV